MTAEMGRMKRHVPVAGLPVQAIRYFLLGTLVSLLAYSV